MSVIKYIVLHCSVSGFGDVEEIRKWHVQGNGWRDIGYNGVILNGIRHSGGDYEPPEDGLLEVGRGFNFDNIIDQSEKGAQARGFNHESLGFCLIGDTKFTIAQFKTALHLVYLYTRAIPGIEVVGHNELPGVRKSCPNFSMIKFRELLREGRFTPYDIEKSLRDFIKE